MIDALVKVLVRHPHLIKTNTPLEVLAAHMVASLNQFEQSLIERSRHDFYHPERRREVPAVSAGPALSTDGADLAGLYRDHPRACSNCED